MFGSRWKQAEATIVARQPKYSGDSTAGYEFVAEVRPSDGTPAFRATVQEPTIAIDFWAPSIGDVVSVLVKADGKVKFDKDDSRLSVKAYRARRQVEFETARDQPIAETPEPGSFFGAQGLGAQGFGAGTQIFTVGGAADPERMRAAAAKLRAAGLGALADQLAGAVPVDPDHAAPADDPAARLSTLENLRDRGLLTDDEYHAQRRRILEEI